MPKAGRHTKRKPDQQKKGKRLGFEQHLPQESKKRPRKAAENVNDLFEAEDEQAEEERAAYKFDEVDNYEYEMPSDFEDEEIDEEMAFTEEDKIKYAGWFDDDGDRPGKKKKSAGQSSLLLDTSEEEGGEDGDDMDPEDEWLRAEELAEEEEEDDDDDIMPHVKDDEEEEEDEEEEDEEDGDEERNRNMLKQLLGESKGKQQEKKKMKRNLVVSETMPESEFNVNPAPASGGDAGTLTVQDLLGGLGDAKSKLGAAGKLLSKMGKKSAPVAAPLPKNIRAVQERKAAYEGTTKEVSKWQPIVKANREAPTLKFTKPDSIPQLNTTAAVVAKFTPQNDMEAEVAALLAKAGAENTAALAEAEQSLALKSLTVEEARARQEKLSKMRNLLFYHELKSKRLKAIKSKEYHRKLNKAAKRAAAAAGADGGDDEQRKALEAVEFERAKERLTLKHKNTSKWARRALKRGVNIADEGTREALAEQLRLGQELRKKVMAEGSDGSDDNSDASTSGTESDGSDLDDGGNIINPAGRSSKAKAEAIDILSAAGALDESQLPSKGLFALPFMKRAITQQKLTAEQEAREVLQELEREEGGDGSAFDFSTTPVGRFTFGGPAATAADRDANDKEQNQDSDEESDENEDLEAKAERLRSRLEASTSGRDSQPQATKSKPSKPKKSALHTPDTGAVADMGLDLDSLLKPGSRPDFLSSKHERTPGHGGAGVSIAGTALPQGKGTASHPTDAAAAKKSENGVKTKAAAGSSRTTKKVSTAVGQQGSDENAHENGVLDFIASRSFAGAKAGYAFRTGPKGMGYYLDGTAVKLSSAQATAQAAVSGKGPAVVDGVDSDDEDGALMRPAKNAPDMSQADLVRMAFAGDDVVGEFAKDKADEVGEELPAVEAPSTLPGWGKWANQKREPKWMVEAREKAQKARDAAAAARKDANMKLVVISEKWDKKAAKFSTPQVPFPFNNKDVYERTMRQPLGREFNTDKAFRDLTRPAILKDTGTIIDPIQYSKPLAQYARSDAAKARSVATVAGGMPSKKKK